MRKIDIIVSLIIGEVVGLFLLGILKNLGIEAIFGIGIKSISLIIPIAFPVLSAFCLYIAFLIGRKFLIVFQAAKFILTGALNTFIDLGILNLLMFVFGIATGMGYSVFKGISFVIATINSYFLNKFWTFDKIETKKTKKEMTQFFLVSIIGFGINIGTASIIVNVVGPQFGFTDGFTDKMWGNVGAIVATFVGMTWNFIGYKFVVFKK